MRYLIVFIEMSFISIFDMISSIYSEPLIHLTTKVTEVTHTGSWDDKYCPVVQINMLLTIITAMLHSHANFTDLDCILAGNFSFCQRHCRVWRWRCSAGLVSSLTTMVPDAFQERAPTNRSRIRSTHPL